MPSGGVLPLPWMLMLSLNCAYIPNPHREWEKSLNIFDSYTSIAHFNLWSIFLSFETILHCHKHVVDIKTNLEGFNKYNFLFWLISDLWIEIISELWFVLDQINSSSSMLSFKGSPHWMAPEVKFFPFVSDLKFFSYASTSFPPPFFSTVSSNWCLCLLS